MKLLEKMINKSNVTIIIIIIISLYHFSVLNVIEKMTCESLFSFDTCKRPNQKCINDANKSVSCLGMPSGHAQQTAFSLTFTYMISGQHFYASWVLFFLTLFQRYVFKNHTFWQLLVGSVLGVAIAYLTLHIEAIIKNLEDSDKDIYLLLKN